MKECVNEKHTTYPHVGSFILTQFVNAFEFQLRNYHPSVSKSNLEKVNRKTQQLHKKLYQVVVSLINHYPSEFTHFMVKYINIMIEFNEYNYVNNNTNKYKDMDHFVDYAQIIEVMPCSLNHVLSFYKSSMTSSTNHKKW